MNNTLGYRQGRANPIHVIYCTANENHVLAVYDQVPKLWHPPRVFGMAMAPVHRPLLHYYHTTWHQEDREPLHQVPRVHHQSETC
jgi:hypothetical protein